MSVKNKDNIFLLKEEVKSYDNFIFENHLANPCKNLIDDIIKNLENYRNICSLLVSQMGAGKTKMIVEVLIPYLFEKTDVRLQIYTVPMNEIIDEFQFLENKPEDKQIIVVNKDARKAYSLLKRGYKVVLLTTHSGIWTNTSYGYKTLIPYIRKELHNKVSVIIDEAHTWTVSDKENYKKVTGNVPKNYEASLFKSVQDISDISPFIFGVTATPNREARNIVDTEGRLNFNIVNDFADPIYLVHKTKWADKTRFYNVTKTVIGSHRNKTKRFTVPDKESIYKELKYVVEEKLRMNKFFPKTSAIIQCKSKLANKDFKKRKRFGISTWNGTVTEMTTLLKNGCKEIGATCSYGIMNEKGFEIHKINKNYNSKLILKPNTFDEFKEYFEDLNDDATFIFVVERGKCGMNIYNLNYFMSIRPYNNKLDEDGVIYESPIQLLGRLVRLWSGMPHYEFIGKYGYDIAEYLRNNPDKVDIIKKINSMNFSMPDNTVWSECDELFRKDYVNELKNIDFTVEKTGFLKAIIQICGGRFNVMESNQPINSVEVNGLSKKKSNLRIVDNDYEGLDKKIIN
tara:strand:+ start:78 stop:1787 length:1710 start_codon:yes stop_codon:yes gene_type:complete